VLFYPFVTSVADLLARRGSEFDIVIIARHYIAAKHLDTVREFAPRALVVFDTVDLHFLREERLAELEGSALRDAAARARREEELAMIRKSDVTLVVSPVEQKLLHELLPEARVMIVSNIHDPVAGGKPFAERFRALCETADVAEAIALYRGLPLYPEPAALEAQVGEGLRSNVKAVFEAIAHHNPYPRQVFDQHRWNHMVLKALFIGSRLAPVEGLDERANAELARIMCDFAHERWAAGRPVPFEIWRCVGPFADDAAIRDLARVLSGGEDVERRAAALALSVCPDENAGKLLSGVPALSNEITSKKLTWATLQ